MQISVADYVFQKVAEHGVRDVFMVSGGGIMYLCDALGRSKSLRYWCNYNEQGTAIAAEGYAKVSEGLGVCLVTTGPGSTNALTGVAGAWVDSIPMLMISGQVRTGIMANYDTQRQVGPQEINILPMVVPITKYAVTVMDASDIRYEMEKCLYLATAGRQGPVWINIPLDVQSAIIEPEKLRPYRPDIPSLPALQADDLDAVMALIKSSRRLLLIGGNGIVLSGARENFRQFVETFKIPTILSISGMDLLPESCDMFMGRFGPGGQRRANLALQNCDLVLAVGTSLSISCIGFSESVAPKAKKVLVNVDAGDLEKRNIRIDLPILCDAKDFLTRIAAELQTVRYRPSQKWIDACAAWKMAYPTKLADEHLQTNCVDLFNFYDHLSDCMGPNDIFVLGTTGDACYVGYQHHHVKHGQRIFTSVCYGAMGWDLPALTGASIAGGSRRTVLVTGDGSMMFNVQELMFVGMHKLNAKIFVCNNDGYQSIRGTQDRFFSGHYVGTDSQSGVANPDFRALAAAFGLQYMRIETNDELATSIAHVFSDEKPWLVEVMESRSQQRFRVSSFRQPDGKLVTRPLDDMEPRLSSDELAYNMSLFGTDEQ